MSTDKRNRRGLRGGKRAHQKHHGPSQDPRRVTALNDARAVEAKLDRTIAWQEAEAAREREEKRAAAQQAKKDAAAARAADAAARRRDWTLGQARSMVRQGYTPQHVVQVTGWPLPLVEDADRWMA